MQKNVIFHDLSFEDEPMSVQLSKISDMKATRSLPDYIMTLQGNRANFA